MDIIRGRFLVMYILMTRHACQMLLGQLRRIRTQLNVLCVFINRSASIIVNGNELWER